MGWETIASEEGLFLPDDHMARGAGMKAIALLTSHKHSTMAEADLIVEDLSHLDVACILSLIS
jgi:phosphoglycolate phosphatase-like HAD superfamily hydrolase